MPQTRRQFISLLARPAILGSALLAPMPTRLVAQTIVTKQAAALRDAEPRGIPADRSIEFPCASTTGYRSAPGYPGKLTPALASDISASGNIYNFMRFDGLALTGSDNVFFGCQFASNWTDGWNIVIKEPARNNRFSHCTISPPDGVEIPHASWPAAGMHVPGLSGSDDARQYQISGTSGYQYGFRILSGGGTTIDACDIWGFANAIDLAGGSNTTITNSWIHDAAFEKPKDYHTDGIGYLDGGSPPHNILIRNCTIASLGNTNGIAFQAALRPYSNIVVDGCLLSGFGYTVDMCHNVVGNSGLKFTNNTLSKRVMPVYGLLYDDFSRQFLGAADNEWFGNKTDEGSFILPNGKSSESDWKNGEL